MKGGFKSFLQAFKKPSESGESIESRGGSDLGEKETGGGRLPPLPDTYTVGGHGKTKIAATSRIAGPGTITKGFGK